jgi:hypothetical protein
VGGALIQRNTKYKTKSVTALSEPSKSRPWIVRRRKVARDSHMAKRTMATPLLLGALAAALLAEGCIIAEPPEFDEPQRTPPVLDLAHATPAITNIQVLEADRGPNHALTFHVPVRSEDLGQELAYRLLLNYGASNEYLEAADSVPPSTFNDTSRIIAFSWLTQRAPVGCQQLTLFVTHSLNRDPETKQLIDPNDVALATWWLDVEDAEGASAPLATCPLVAGDTQ